MDTREMRETRKLAGMPHSVAYMKRLNDASCELTEKEKATLRRELMGCLEDERPVAIVTDEIAEAFGMRNLPNVIVMGGK